MIIALKCGSLNKPTLEITESNKDQVVIRLLPFGQEHITLHRQKDGIILATHYMDNKPPSAWDDMTVQVARTLGYRNPERHGGYTMHRPLFKMVNGGGYNLMGRRIDLNSFNPRQWYYNHIDKTIGAPENIFMLNFHLSTLGNECDSSLQRIMTVLGDVCFSFNDSNF
jgi:hypothetical protein